MKEIAVPPILSMRVKWCPFMHPHLKTIPLAPIHPFSKQMIHLLCPESLFSPVLCVCLIKGFLPSTAFLCVRHFFFVSFIFIAHFSGGLIGAYVNPGSFLKLSFVHSVLCQITHSFLNGFQPNLYQHFSHACSTCHTIFSLKQTLECI